MADFRWMKFGNLRDSQAPERRSIFWAVAFFAALFLGLSLLLNLLSTSPSGQGRITESIHLGDPFALRVDRTYYLFGTQDTDRGFPVYRSSDLARWDSIGYAYQRTDSSWARRALWAPEVLAYRGKYYLTYSAIGPVDSVGYQLCLAVADDPAGPFTDLRTPWLTYAGWKTIDAHLFIDTDGTPYLFFNRVGIRGEGRQMYGNIYVVRLSEDLMRAETEPELVVAASQPWEAADPAYNSNANEGAFVFREGDTYYLTYSSGHYKSPRYGIGVATASSPLGPWTKSETNPLLQSDYAVGRSGPGHASITSSPDGRTRYLVYHVHADPDNPGPERTVRIAELRISNDGGGLELEVLDR
jgi:beta-xylosidase